MGCRRWGRHWFLCLCIGMVLLYILQKKTRKGLFRTREREEYTISRFTCLVTSFLVKKQLITVETYKVHWEPMRWGSIWWLWDRFGSVSRFRTSFDLRIGISPHSHNLLSWKFLWITDTRLLLKHNRSIDTRDGEKQREMLNYVRLCVLKISKNMKILSKPRNHEK